MRRLLFALVLLIASAAPTIGLTTARADQPCFTETTTSTGVGLANQHFDGCLPIDDPPPDDSTCVHEYGTLPVTGTLAYEVKICVPT
ncbi:MAG: hypothetical protein QOG34_848 [Frankiaceae bacterium]|nr:hypothetical protein [Frankiaceae bacterium]